MSESRDMDASEQHHPTWEELNAEYQHHPLTWEQAQETSEGWEAYRHHEEQATGLPGDIQAWLDAETGEDIIRETLLPLIGPVTIADLVHDFKEEVGMDLARVQNRLAAGTARYPMEASESLNTFARLVNAHDLTHDYSDDPQCRRRGAAQLKAIRAMAEELPQADVTRIWNAMVDRFLVPDARQQYYWHDPTPWQQAFRRRMHQMEQREHVPERTRDHEQDIGY